MCRLFTLASLILALPLAAQVVWLNPEHDFGSFNEDMGIVTCTFYGVNTGTEPAAIIDVRANCGCTTPTYSHDPVAPGDTLKIKVGYNPAGRPGKFAKSVYATTDNGVKSTFRIKGTVIGASNTLASRFPIEAFPARLSNSVVPFGKILKGQSGAQTVKIYNASPAPITPQVASNSTHIHTVIKPETIPAGEQGVISLTAYSDQTSNWGLTTDTLWLQPDPLSSHLVPLTTVMIVEEDFSSLSPEQLANAPVPRLSTDILDFGRITHEKPVIKLSFSITNAGKSPLTVRSISTPDPAIAIAPLKIKPIKPGKKATFTVSVNTNKLAQRAMLNSRITIISNSPQHPTEIVRVVGEL